MLDRGQHPVPRIYHEAPVVVEVGILEVWRFVGARGRSLTSEVGVRAHARRRRAVAASAAVGGRVGLLVAVADRLLDDRGLAVVVRHPLSLDLFGTLGQAGVGLVGGGGGGAAEGAGGLPARLNFSLIVCAVSVKKQIGYGKKIGNISLQICEYLKSWSKSSKNGIFLVLINHKLTKKYRNIGFTPTLYSLFIT